MAANAFRYGGGFSILRAVKRADAGLRKQSSASSDLIQDYTNLTRDIEKHEPTIELSIYLDTDTPWGLDSEGSEAFYKKLYEGYRNWGVGKNLEGFEESTLENLADISMKKSLEEAQKNAEVTVGMVISIVAGAGIGGIIGALSVSSAFAAPVVAGLVGGGLVSASAYTQIKRAFNG